MFSHPFSYIVYLPVDTVQLIVQQLVMTVSEEKNSKKNRHFVKVLEKIIILGNKKIC